MNVPATLALEEASGRLWDAIVVGAGPAGALAARELGRRGAATLLVDRATFPRWKVCGACLNEWALETLAAVGLGDLAAVHGATPLNRFVLNAGQRQAQVSLRGGVALSREKLDAALIEAAVQAGACFLPGTQARLAAADSTTCRQLILHRDGRERRVDGRIILAADGLGSTLLAREAGWHATVKPNSRVGAGVIANDGPAAYTAGTIFMACGRSGYVGLVRLEDGRLNVAAAFDRLSIGHGGGPGEAAASVLAEAGFPAIGGLAEFSWRGTPLLTRRVSTVACHRAFALGDAAGYVEPFTGEGMAWALAAARAVTPLAYRACRNWQPELVGAWSTLHSRIVGRQQRICRVVAQVLRHPILTRAVIATLARAPALAEPVVGYVSRSRPAFLRRRTGGAA